MGNPDGELTVAERLGRALDRGLLPAGGPAEAAERLIERLERPARVALLGLPGSGKSSILNLLVGSPIVPETLRLPTIMLQHGDVARMICTLTDGTTKILPGNDLAAVLPLAPALVTLEADLAALKVIGLLEVSAGPMEAEQKRAATWASKRADIVIWCSTSYLPKEQAVWESLPDSVKDNSFMFLTKVDLLGSRESALAMHERVELRAGEEFRQILSISAKQARQATGQGGAVNRDLFRDSGASAVIAAIKTRVQSGRRADMDTAELLLARHVEASELVARLFAEPGDAFPAPEAWAPPPEPEAATPEVPEAATVEAGVADALPAAEPAPTWPEAADLEEDAGAPAQEPAAPEADPGSDPAMRRRCADRIRRVAAEGEGAVPPMVPLKSTWKSKAEAEPEPPPPVRQAEPARRPRPAAPSRPDDATDLARSLAGVVSATAPPPELPPPETPVPDTPEAIGLGPPVRTPEPEAARAAARPQRFGARRASAAQDKPLPDLSALRATPEEIAASAEANGEEEMPPQQVPSQSEAEADLPIQAPEVQAPAPEFPSAGPAQSVERARMFGREPRVRPAATTAPPRPEPVQGPPAAPRIPGIAAHEPAVSRLAQDEAQFSPRAIMMRERRDDPETPVPRRERPRIAARAVPATPVPEVPATVPRSDQALAGEAVALILARSAELEREVAPDAKVPVDLILEHSRETGEMVQAVVARGQSEAMRRINSDLGEVMDLIMLMQLEKGHAPADDALTLLLQLRRELETLCAA
jgi:hypothetical protein